MTWSLASIGLLLGLCFSRSARAGFSGPISTVMGLFQIPFFVLALVIVFSGIGWWCVLPVAVAAFLAGMTIDSGNISAWVNLQPIVGLLSFASTTAAAILNWS